MIPVSPVSGTYRTGTLQVRSGKPNAKHTVKKQSCRNCPDCKEKRFPGFRNAKYVCRRFGHDITAFVTTSGRPGWCDRKKGGQIP